MKFTYNNYIFIFFIILGLIHWFCFSYISDYYSYKDVIPQSNIDLEKYNENTNKLISLEKLKNSGDFKGDKDLIKFIIKEKNLNVSKLFTFNFYTGSDWFKENAYLNVISNSLKDGIIPFHVNNLPEIVTSSNKFLGSPIYSLSPQIYLLKFIDVEVFNFINLILMFFIGAYGIFLIGKFYNLKFISFSLLFFLFNFNGYFITNYAAYGPSQLGYFFMPYFFYGLIRISHANIFFDNYNWSIFVGIILSLILLQGALHLYIQLLTLILFWTIFNIRNFKSSLIIGVVTISTSLFRLFPAYLSYGTEANPHALEKGYAGGYANIDLFISGLVSQKTQFDFPEEYWHELSMYISFPGSLIIIFFGIFCYFFDKNIFNYKIWKGFVIPILIIFLISFHKIKFLILPNFIPLFNSESITSRYMIIPLFFIIIVSSVNLDLFLKNNTKKLTLYITGILVYVIVIFLFNFSRLWRHNLSLSELKWADSLNINGRVFLENNYQLNINNDFSDTLYIWSFFITLIISLLSYIIFGYIFFKNKR